MYKSFFIATLLFLMLSSHSTILSMISYKDLKLANIPQHIFTYFSLKDLNNCRLVCKEWAPKGSNWTFMPHNVERVYSKIIQTTENKSLKTPLITCLFAFYNKKPAIEWIQHNIQDFKNSMHLQLRGPTVTNDCITNDCIIRPAMFAVHNKNEKMAQYLIETDTYYQNEYWTIHYNIMTVPQSIQQCLPHSHNRDFSFLPYIASMWIDNAYGLQQLYSQKVPTHYGQKFLIGLAMYHNANNCFDFLLKNKAAHEIILSADNSSFLTHFMFNCLNFLSLHETANKLIRNNDNSNKSSFTYFTTTLILNRKKMAQKMLEHHLFDIHLLSSDQTKTILDMMLDPNIHKQYPHAAGILKRLGAKTYKQLIEEQHYRETLSEDSDSFSD